MSQTRTGRIERIDTFGDFAVYRRCWNEPGMRRFVVFRDSDGKALEEFRTLGSAITWAQRTNREQEDQS